MLYTVGTRFQLISYSTNSYSHTATISYMPPFLGSLGIKENFLLKYQLVYPQIELFNGHLEDVLSTCTI